MQAQSTQPFQILSREEPSPVTIHLTVEVDATTTQRMFERALRGIGRYLRVPGFRPGQAPLPMLRRMVPEENLRRAAGELMMDEFIPKVLQQEQLEPYRPPQVNIERLQEGEPFRFKLTVPLRPVVEKLGEYRDLRFPIPPQATSDEEVEQALESLRKQQMKLEAAPDRPAQTDDRLIVGIQSLEEENARRNRYMITLGQTFGALDNLLAGMREGETKEATLTFPESFDDPELAGKTLTVAVSVERILAPVYPELNDEFAKQFGFDDLNTMREGIRERITQQKLEYLQDQARNQALAVLRERSIVHLPDALIDEQLREEIAEFSKELVESGTTLEQFIQQTGLTGEEVREQLRQRVAQEIRLDRALKKLLDIVQNTEQGD